MTPLHKALAGGFLIIALAAGVGAYLASRPQTVPDGYLLTDLTGAQRELAEFRGRPLLVNFWATWCPPCRREIPLLIQLQTEFSQRGLTVVGIAVEEPAPVLRLAEEFDFNYPVLIGEQPAIDLAEALGIQFVGLPYTVFIDAHGRVQQIHTGELHRDDAELALAELLR